MEDTWHAKCSSTRAPPPPEPSSVPSLATPTSLLPSLSAGSVNCKMSRNSKKFSHSSAQEMSLGDAAICQGSMVFNTLNLDSRKSEKGGMTNSFLDLLSGNSQNLSTDIRQTLNSRTPPAKHQIHDNIGVNGASCGLPVTSTPLLLGNQGNAATVNRGLSPFVASPTSNLTGTKAPLLHDSIQAAAFPCHGRDSRKLPRTFQGNISAMEVSSGRQGWPTSSSSSSSNANQKHILNPTSQAMPLEDKRSVSNVTSAFRGRPHVFCMNKVGELFVTEMGLLGVLCFCHKLPMSVANFCEHSGSLSANPGEAVRLENGMTVSQWRMLCSGIMASDHDYGWDWSNDSSAQSIFHRSKLSNYPASAKNPIPVNSMEAFGGLRRFAEPGDNFSFTDHIYTAQHGQTDLEKSTNKVADNAYNRNNLMRYNPFTKSFTASLQRMTPVLSNKYTAQGGKENPVSISFQGASSNYNKREGNIGLQLAQNNVNYKSEVGNLPVSFAYSETKDSSLCSQNMSRGIFLSEAYVLDKEGASSNVELSLGHPFQNMHPPQLGTTCNSQNPHQPQPLTHITDFPKEAKRPRLDLGGTSSGTPLLNRRKLYHSGRSNSSKGFESDPMSDATKNSLISFLSHLNNEANNPSQSTVDIGNYNECFMSKVHDRDSLHAKCNLSGFMRGKADGIEWKIHTNKSAVSSDVGRGTEPGVICDGSYSILKPNHLVHNKQTADVRLPASEHFIQSRFVDDNKQTELNIDQPSGMLHTISDTRNFEQAQMSLSLTKSTYIPEQTSDLSCKKNNDTTQSLNDERLRYLSQRNMDELSKTERCTSSLEMNPHHRRFCCLSDVKFQKNICGDEPDAPERLRDSCIIQRDAYKTDVRSGRSFSGCCGCDHQVVATRSGKPVGSYQCCNCSASTQRTLFCSKDHGIQFSTCHLCGANKQPCLRLCTISSNSSGNPKHEVGNLKVESPSSGKCCCTASPKYLTGCCFSGGDILSNVLNGHVCGKAKVAHVYPNPPYDNMHMLQDEKVVRLGQCECSRKNVMKNNSRIAVWRDVPSKAVGHSGTTSNEKPSNIPHTARASGDQVTETATKELEETQKESDSIKEQQMSNVCSGSSAPAVTEASFEVNNAISFVTDAENAKAMDDLVVDEGSRIEKCGSSDEALDNVCEKANILKNKTKTIKYGLHYLPSSSSVDLVDELTLKNSSNLKCLKNQNDAVCAAEKITSQIRKLDWSGKAVKRKRWSKFDFASPFSEFSEHVGPSSHNSSSNEIEPPSQLECVMQKAAKRKRSALSSTKALPPKGHENHHKVGEIEYRKMLSIDDDRCLRKHTVLVGMKAKQHTSNIVKQKHNNATAGKPPKFLSLSCIGNLNNFDTDTACKKARPVVCDNLGVISTGLCDQEKPAKIVPLSLVLKKSTRCYITESEGERKAAFASKTHLTDSGCYMVSSSSKLQHVNADFSTINNGTEPTILVSGDDHHTPDLSQKMIKLASTLDAGLANNIQNEQAQAGDLCEVNRRRSCKGNKCESFLQDSNAFCSVCGSSNKGDVNHLLECNRCLVRVHQACYGVVKVPKGRWCCRPCKTNSLNIVCVLCGYGGGAMTRALKSEHIAKGLLKAWKIGVEPDPISSITENKFLKQSPVNEESERKGLIVGESFSSDAYPTDVSKRGLHKTNNIQHSDCSENNHEACNSITAGVLDPSVTQWVHMVCGLWTPGTRCPNVDTMSTFDVSGASPSRKKMVCAMCNRSGGSCIQCRVLNCTVRFHPWCAHQKGLLQSEIEGDNNEKVGFYGRCVHHATHNISHIHSLPVGPEVESPGKKDWTCARTKGFKGRKRDEGFNPDHQKPYNDGGGCIVSQEQINAWLHINGHKSCIRGVTKPRCSEMEYGIQFAKGSFSLMQKEYLRYKQTKGWKHLVVYKSGIHALGLYTSQFITRGAMVVEYVGEIVSLRVADKRELEYQSGRKLQYKSACYFFRIDKEHIIDATRKGGIARFVNHSCLPNCVAKIISVRNEKKVVFFAERDIYPGEEITYDYHFNHEDEGEKIPCFCNSKNCRLYLN